jgi:hypothetical protein
MCLVVGSVILWVRAIAETSGGVQAATASTPVSETADYNQRAAEAAMDKEARC